MLILPGIAEDLIKEAKHYYEIHQKFSDEILQGLHSVFGPILFKAAELLENGHVTVYKTQNCLRSFTRIGNSHERHIIFNDINYCNCSFFDSEVLRQKSALTCRHVLAVRLLHAQNETQHEMVSDVSFRDLLNIQSEFVLNDFELDL